MLCVVYARTSFADDVTTHVEGGSGAVVMKQTDDEGRRWMAVCTSPCTAQMERGAIYKIAGDSVRESKPFRFVPSTDDVTLSIAAARPSLHTFGVVGVIVGPIVVVGTSVVLALSSIGGGNSESDWAARGCFAAGLGVGFVGFIVALALLGSNGSTDVHIFRRASNGSLPPIRAALDVATRTYVFTPPLVGVPLLNATF